MLTVRIELRVVELCVSELLKDFLPKAPSTLSHTREHSTAIVSELARPHEPWVLHGAEGLVRRAHLLIHFWTLTAVIDYVLLTRMALVLVVGVHWIL